MHYHINLGSRGGRHWVAIPTAACLSAASVFIGTAPTVASTRSPRAVEAAKAPWVIDLSNTSLDNGWRLEMQAAAKLAAKSSPLSHEIHLNIVNAANTVAAQIQSVQSMIAAHVNAIIIDANSPTALNTVMNEAVSKGIPVFSIDSPTTSTKVYHIGTNLVESGYIEGYWLAEELHGRGNVVMSEGIAGTGGAQEENKGGFMALKQFPHIHIIDQYDGQWADAPSEQGMASVLATHNNVDGVWNEGGAYGVMEAFLKAGDPLVPITGYAFNNFLLAPFSHPSLKMIAGSNPCFMSVTAIEDAVKVLEGKGASVPKQYWFPITMYEYPNLLKGMPTHFSAPGEAGWTTPVYTLDVKGTTAVPGVSAEFSWPFLAPGFHYTLKQLEAAM
jgi:ribose transport system substrate-binding protein